MNELTPEIQNTIDLSSEKKLYSRIIFSYFLLVLITVVAQFIINLILAFFGIELLDYQWLPWVLSLVPIYLIAAPVCLAVLKPIPVVKAKKFNLSFKHWLKYFSIAIFLMYIGNMIGLAFNAIMAAIFDLDPQNSIEAIVTSSSPIYTIIFAVIIGPLLEELFFRKILIDRLTRYGERSAILLSALMFGLFHGNLFQFFYAFFLGIIFGYVYARTHKLRYSAAMHMTINTLGGVIAPYFISKSDDLDNLSAGLLNGQIPSAGDITAILGLSIYGLFILSFAIAGLIFLIRNFRKAVLFPGSVSIPKGKGFSFYFVNYGMICFLIVCLAVFIISLL